MQVQSLVTSIKFNKFDPMIFPEQMVWCRCFAAIVTTKISGAIVPRANRANPMNVSDILKRFQIL
jgi:hypothetical protein